MAAGEGKDLRDLTRALAAAQDRLLKVCEALNTNLLAAVRNMQKTEICSDRSCDSNCSICKGRPNGL